MLENDLPTTLARLGLATVLGLALGGLRTHGLVTLSSAMLTLSALEMVEQHNEGDPVRVVQGLAQAIGFIAGGLIFVLGGDVRNMSTAASLWMAAAVGITAGAGQYVLVLAGTVLALLLLSAAFLFERFMTKSRRQGPVDTTDDIQMPNRRGSPRQQDGEIDNR
ncbi:MgtC/SapB family protein [Sphingobium indicum]|uniref:MgtC/SapB family protein n=1 Tax=Sphingobium indicum TaxID=332055 RepID=UPI00055AD804|nr:MgtC/SapB family protein [Sphingobium indicum]